MMDAWILLCSLGNLAVTGFLAWMLMIVSQEVTALRSRLDRQIGLPDERSPVLPTAGTVVYLDDAELAHREREWRQASRQRIPILRTVAPRG